MGPFNNREIATAIWLLLFTAWALHKANIRKSLAHAVRAFCHFKILASLCLMLLYAGTAVALLAVLGLWQIALLKDTIVWFCGTAIATMVRFGASHDSEHIFRKVLVDSVKIVILLEFLVNTYSFSLPAELAIVPILTVNAVINAVASLDKKDSAVAKVTGRAQVVIGLVIVAIALGRAIADLQSLHSMDTVRSVALAPVLSLLLSPFVYMMVLISRYELVFVMLTSGIENQVGLKRYARRRIVMHARLSLRRLQHLLRKHLADSMHIQTKADVDCLLRQAQSIDSSQSEE